MNKKIKGYIEKLTKDHNYEPEINEIYTLEKFEEVFKETEEQAINAFIASLSFDIPLYYQSIGYCGHQFGYDNAYEIDIEYLEAFLYSLPEEIKDMIQIEFIHSDLPNKITYKREILNKFAGRYYPMNIITGESK